MNEDGVQREESADPTEETKAPEVKPIKPKEYLNMKPVFYYLITILCYVVVVVLSIVVGDVSVFFGIIGATAGCWIIIAGPASFYVISVHKYNIKMDSLLLKLSYCVAWVYICVGVSGMIGLNVCVISNAATK